MVKASGVELRLASRAVISALQVPADRHPRATRTAQDSLAVPLGPRPHLDFVIGQGNMAVFAGVKNATALHFDCDDVDGLVEVCAPGLRIDIDSPHFWQVRVHVALSDHRLAITPAITRWSAVPHRSRRFAGSDRRNGSQKSNGGPDPWHPAIAFDRDYWDARTA
jgi:hypothetical protein